MQNDENVFIEITTTDNCNCHCSYCFEGAHCKTKPRNLRYEEKFLSRLAEFCESFKVKHPEAGKADSSCRTCGDKSGPFVTISFWGGEPFMNEEFLEKIVGLTRGYDFTRYHVYSNGTLVEAYRKFLSSSCCDESVKKRFHVQLSYDGSPHNEIKRGYTREKVIETAKLLDEAGVLISFKATLSFDMIPHLPEIWKSYAELEDMFPNSGLVYAPTLDTNVSDGKWIDDWKKAVVEVAKLEREHILTRGRPLWSWLMREWKSNCRLKNSLHVHSDGNIYVCHGSPYAKCKQLKLGTLQDDTFEDILARTYDMQKIPRAC